MIKKIMLICLVSIATGFSQTIDNKNLIEKIKTKSATFLLEKGEIENIENINFKISIIEILNNKVIGYNEIGIYRLYSHKSPSCTYILLKKKSKIKIIDLRYFSNSFPEIIEFLKDSSFDEDKKILYLEKIIEVYNNNNYQEKIKL